MTGLRSPRTVALIVGVLLIAAGIALVVAPLVGVWQRSQADNAALAQWQAGGASAVVGAVKGPAAHTTVCGGNPANYALVTFANLDNYSGVSGDGDWSLLDTRSMVHWHGSADPGQLGNMMIAFHREPDFEHIDQLGVGALVTVENQACKTFTYKITQRWVLAPDKVTQLVPTSDAEITLITCTPWWVDTQRLVWRGVLVA